MDGIPRWQPTKRRIGVSELFFEDGDIACKISQIIPVMLDAHEDFGTEDSFICHTGGCEKRFDSVLSFERHYNTCHRYVCSECRHCFPTNRLLDIHIFECHDAMFQLQSLKENMYQCLVDGCSQIFKDTKERKNHLVKIHKYPASFRFNRISSKNPGKVTTEHNLNTKVSRRIPSIICFGHGATKSFSQNKKKRKSTKVNIEDINMTDLADSLNS